MKKALALVLALALALSLVACGGAPASTSGSDQRLCQRHGYRRPVSGHGRSGGHHGEPGL